MQWKIRSVVILTSIMALCFVTHASEQKSMFSTQTEKNHSDANKDKIDMNDAIKIYLNKNPPDALSKSLCSAIEKAQPASIPEVDREKALSHFKKNVTPEILTKMISAGLKRNFTAEEIYVISKYDESQLSENLKKKNNLFRYEVSSQIGLLLAATSG